MNALSCSAWLQGKDTTIPRDHLSRWALDTFNPALDTYSFLFNLLRSQTLCFLPGFLDSFPADDGQARLRMLTASTALVTDHADASFKLTLKLLSRDSATTLFTVPPSDCAVWLLLPSFKLISIIRDTRCLARFRRYVFVLLWQSWCCYAHWKKPV